MHSAPPRSAPPHLPRRGQLAVAMEDLHLQHPVCDSSRGRGATISTPPSSSSIQFDLWIGLGPPAWQRWRGRSYDRGHKPLQPQQGASAKGAKFKWGSECRQWRLSNTAS